MWKCAIKYFAGRIGVFSVKLLEQLWKLVEHWTRLPLFSGKTNPQFTCWGTSQDHLQEGAARLLGSAAGVSQQLKLLVWSSQGWVPSATVLRSGSDLCSPTLHTVVVCFQGTTVVHQEGEQIWVLTLKKNPKCLTKYCKWGIHARFWVCGQGGILWLPPVQMWCVEGLLIPVVWSGKKNESSHRYCFHWSGLQVRIYDSNYSRWVNCPSPLMCILLLLQCSQTPSVFAFHSQCFPTPRLCALRVFLNLILWHNVFIPIHFSLKIPATIPWKDLCNSSHDRCVQLLLKLRKASKNKQNLRVFRVNPVSWDLLQRGRRRGPAGAESPPQTPALRSALPLPMQRELTPEVETLWLGWCFSEEGLFFAVPNTGFWQARQHPLGMFASA